MPEYRTVQETIDPRPNRKTLVGSGVATITAALFGSLGLGVLRGVGLGLLVGAADFVAEYYTRPAPGDGVLMKVEPEPPDDADHEDALHS